MKLHATLLSCAALLALAACSQKTDVAEGAAADPSAAPAPETEEAVMPADETAACPVLASRNWTAWVNAMPGPDMKPALHVAGEIDLPAPGYAIAWREGMADRSATPVQRLILTATPPAGIVTPAVTTESVTYEGPALVVTYGGVIVMCGGEPLAQIDEVTVAQ